jgi:penicillin-binding protein 1C
MIHRAIPIDPTTGLRSCWHTPGKTQLQVYQFWPSDFLNIFKMAGIALKPPPAYRPDCQLNQQSASGQKPKIQSPQGNIIYALSSNKANSQMIPLTAIVDADVSTLFWFVDDAYIGKTKNNESLFWTPDSGQFTVRVVDDHGRAAQGKVSVKQVN